MGFPIDDPVQQSPPAGDKTLGGFTDEKISVSAHDHAYKQHGNTAYPYIEDSLACADAQYANNNVIPEGDTRSPQDSILSGPLRFLWGPSTPKLAVEAPKPLAANVTPEEELEETTAKELRNRSQLRKVTAAGAFYLITTDIFGPFSTPYGYSQLGYVPGTLLYFFLAICAWYAGNLLSVMYLRLDSDRLPIRNYGQLAARIFGLPGRTICDILMIIQLVVNCGTILLSNAQSMAQIIDNAPGSHHLCFIVCILIFLVINLLLSPVRSLRGVAFFSNVAVFLNFVLIFATIAFVSVSKPNYEAAKASYGISAGPVHAVAFVSQALEAKVNGVMNLVFAYGGAMVFVDFLSEMKRPWDFWKAMSCAQTFIFCLYILLGLVVYSQQGQFTQSLAYYGVSPYSMQTFGNVIGFVTGTIAALLYGNIAVKLCYSTIVERWCNGPALMTNRGWAFWGLVNCIFWPIAFVIGGAIPQIQTISGLIAAICILQFSYTFPFVLKWGFDMQILAMAGDEPYTPGTVPNRADGWLSASRWRRALFTGGFKQQIMNWAHLALFLASAALACLGMWGSGTSIKETFAVAQASSFGCASPGS